MGASLLQKNGCHLKRKKWLQVTTMPLKMKLPHTVALQKRTKTFTVKDLELPAQKPV